MTAQPLATIFAGMLAATPSLCTAQDAPQPESAPTRPDLQQILQTVIRAHKVPAVGGLVLMKGEVLEVAVAGSRRSDKPDEAVTIDDAWHLGSCTKAMTATLCGKYVEEGKLSWDRTLPQMFEGIDVHEDLTGVTLGQLLSHRSGLMDNPIVGDLWPTLWQWDGPIRKARTLLAETVLPLRASHDPGHDFVYSNTGYMIAGAALERVADASWEEQMQRQVFAPLGIENAGFGPPGRGDAKATPIWGHDADGTPCDPDDLSSDNPSALGPAGTACMPLRDWARFVDLYARHAVDEERLLQPETLRKITTPRDGEDYAFGWMRTERSWANGPVITHSGSNTMWMCATWISPDDGLAVLATCNQGGEKGSRACDFACSLMIRRARKSGE